MEKEEQQEKQGGKCYVSMKDGVKKNEKNNMRAHKILSLS
jgi:hypothetical protein